MDKEEIADCSTLLSFITFFGTESTRFWKNSPPYVESVHVYTLREGRCLALSRNPSLLYVEVITAAIIGRWTWLNLWCFKQVFCFPIYHFLMIFRQIHIDLRLLSVKMGNSVYQVKVGMKYSIVRVAKDTIESYGKIIDVQKIYNRSLGSIDIDWVTRRWMFTRLFREQLENTQ